VLCAYGGQGGAAVVFGGNHGDEYIGQVAAGDLWRSVVAGDVEVTGRLIVVPCLSPDAARQGTRLWPGGANFNRSFPGSAQGPPHEMLADLIVREIFPVCETVIDVHSGGMSMMFAPTSHMHVVADRALRSKMFAGMQAWNTPYHVLYSDVAGSGLLPVAAEQAGKVVITTELGGSGYIAGSLHRLAADGLVNVLAHQGVVRGEVRARESGGLPPAEVLDAREDDCYHFASTAGLFESLVDVGDRVAPGEPIGRLHLLDDPGRRPSVVASRLGGVVWCVRAIPLTRQGDCLVVVGSVTSKDEVLA